MSKHSANKAGGSDGVAIAVRVPRRVVERIDTLAEQTGLSRGQMLRLLLNRINDDAIPPGLIEAAEAIRAARGVA